MLSLIKENNQFEIAMYCFTIVYYIMTHVSQSVSYSEVLADNQP